jgi:hypothetical protein
VNLNHPGHYVHRGVVRLSVANLIVIVLMIVVFVLRCCCRSRMGGVRP